MTHTNPPAPAMQEAAQAAARILTYLGIAQEVSMEPGSDRRRDHIQSLIADALSKLRAPVADEPHGGTRWPVLRAMARNYTPGKHTWDALDAEACEQAAEEIRHLRAALASAPVAGEAQPVCWIERTQLERVRDEGDDAWVYWREDGHAAESDEMPLYAAPQATEVAQVRRDTLLSVLGKLNGNPYSLTKYECIDLVREMFDKADAALSAQPAEEPADLAPPIGASPHQHCVSGDLPTGRNES